LCSSDGTQENRPPEFREFNIVILSDGIQANEENDRIAEICGLSQDKNGFLYANNEDNGIYVAGTARAPMKIDEVYADSITVANKIITSLPSCRKDSEVSV